MQQVGVCRDFAHLAITFCRCLNIPARYATGYLGDIGVPPDHGADGFFRMVRSVFERGPKVRGGIRSTRGTIAPVSDAL